MPRKRHEPEEIVTKLWQVDVLVLQHQIEDGMNGFLMNNAEEAAARIVELLKNAGLRRLGRKACESVRSRFLMTRLMEDWLDLIGSFEVRFQLKGAAQR